MNTDHDGHLWHSMTRGLISAGPQDHTRNQLVKYPPAMQEILVQFLGREDPLEKG